MSRFPLLMMVDMFMRCLISVMVLYFIVTNTTYTSTWVIGIISIMWILIPFIDWFDLIRKEFKEKKK